MANSFANFTVTKDATLAASSYGAGADVHLVVGSEGGSTRNREALLYAAVSKPSGFVSLVNAWLYVRCYSGTPTGHDTVDDGMTFYAKRLTGSWSEGTYGADHAYYTANAVTWPGPNDAGTTDRATGTFDAGAWEAVNITSMVSKWLAGTATNYGIRLEATGDGTDAVFYSRETSSDPYIRIEYTTNTVPDPPTAIQPPPPAVVASQTPTLSFWPQDDQGDTHTAYDYQVGTASDFLTGVVESQTVTGSFPNGVQVDRVVQTTLTRGQLYYWRVRTKDAIGYGAWAGAFSFTVDSTSAPTITQPAASSIVKPVLHADYRVGAQVDWTFTDPQAGDFQTAYQVKLYADSGGTQGSMLAGADTGKVYSSAGTAQVWPTAGLTEGAYIWVGVTTWDTADMASTESVRRTRARWGFIQHKLYLGADAPSSWALEGPALSVGGNQGMLVQYASTATDTTPSGWTADFGLVTRRQYFHYRAWLFAWGGASSPSFDYMKLSFVTASGVPPDGWDFTDSRGLFFIDKSTFVYGTQSLSAIMDGAGGATLWAWVAQKVAVRPYTWHVLSGRVKFLKVGTGDPGAWLEVRGAGIYTNSVNVTADWTRVSSAPFLTGSETEITVICATKNAAGSAGSQAWFDATKLEASTVVTPWQPGYVGRAVAIDAGGLMIDSSAGGILRLRGSSGGARARIELGTEGLLFGGDAHVSSPATNQLLVPPLVVGLQGGLGSHEGGEITLDGEGSDPDVTIDNYAGKFRVHGSGYEPLWVEPAISLVTVNGELVVTGEISASNMPYSNGATPTSTYSPTLTTVSAWYVATSSNCTFVPRFVGQKFLLLAKYTFNYADAATNLKAGMVLKRGSTTVVTWSGQTQHSTGTANWWDTAYMAQVYTAVADDVDQTLTAYMAMLRTGGNAAICDMSAESNIIVIPLIN